jgi:hypothetical protein
MYNKLVFKPTSLNNLSGSKKCLLYTLNTLCLSSPKKSPFFLHEKLICFQANFLGFFNSKKTQGAFCSEWSQECFFRR